MREISIYLISGLASLFILGFSVHILIGGMVDKETEAFVIGAVVLADLGVIGWMARDVLRTRRGGG